MFRLTDAGEDAVQDLKASKDRDKACHKLRPRVDNINIVGYLLCALMSFAGIMLLCGHYLHASDRLKVEV